MFVNAQYCISAQQTAKGYDVTSLPEPPVNNHFLAKEPDYPLIPASSLRRMGKLVRMGLGAGLPLLNNLTPSAIIMATANAGKDDCVNFLNQIIDYDEGMLTPLNFVQSTPNSLAGQIGLLTSNRAYNITHVHLGHAFENALIDATMRIAEIPGVPVLLGAADDLNNYHELYELKSGWVKHSLPPGKNFLQSNTAGAFHGEAAAMFIVSDIPENALLQIKAIEIWDGKEIHGLTSRAKRFLETHNSTPDNIVFFSGENGDNRLTPYYETMESLFNKNAVFTYKAACGEFPTSTAFALWLAGESYRQNKWPNPLLKKGNIPTNPEQILIYNTYKGFQHSLILLQPV